jgi:hypothetical protein
MSSPRSYVRGSHGDRTSPAGYYWPGADDEPRLRFGLGGPDPTAL